MRRLQAERKRRGWSQQTLGFYAKIAAQDISKIERGWLMPYPSQAERLAQVLQIRPDQLLDELKTADVGLSIHAV